MKLKDIKVLHVIASLERGGAEMELAEVVRLTAPFLARVHIVCCLRKGPIANQLESEGYTISCLNQKKMATWSNYQQLKEFIREESPTIVQSWIASANVIAPKAAAAVGIPARLACIRSLDNWKSKTYQWIDRWACQYWSAAQAVSQSVKEYTHTQMHFPLKDIHVIYNGTVQPSSLNPSEREHARKQLGLQPQHHVMMTAGRCVPVKRQDLMIRAFKSIDNPNLKLWIFGEGPLFEEHQRLASSDSRIEFKGWTDQLSSILPLVDSFCLSSDREGFSRALLEACSHGLPALVTPVGGNAEIVEHHKNGLICPGLAENQFIESMNSFFKDLEPLTLQAKNYQNQILERFSQQRSQQQYLDLYEQLCPTST